MGTDIGDRWGLYERRGGGKTSTVGPRVEAPSHWSFRFRCHSSFNFYESNMSRRGCLKRVVTPRPLPLGSGECRWGREGRESEDTPKDTTSTERTTDYLSNPTLGPELLP